MSSTFTLAGGRPTRPTQATTSSSSASQGGNPPTMASYPRPYPMATRRSRAPRSGLEAVAVSPSFQARVPWPFIGLLAGLLAGPHEHAAGVEERAPHLEDREP